MPLIGLFVAAILAQHVVAQNMLRFACSQLTIERADPLVNPGMAPTRESARL